MQRTILMLWPSFLVAAVAEAVFFTVIDPQQLYLFGQPVHFSPVTTYSLGFFGFWAVCAATSLLTCFLQRPASEVNQSTGSSAGQGSGGCAAQR